MRPIAWLLVLIACGGGEGEPAAVETTVAADNARAQEGLRSLDLDAAESGWRSALMADAGSVDAAVGLAWIASVDGDLQRADGYLAQVEPSAGARTGEVVLRRALLAAEMGEYERVARLGEASGHSLGLLLAAEAALADSEVEEASRLLRRIVGEDSEFGDTAGRYLELLEDPDPTVAALAENYALWALGDRIHAVRGIAPLIRAIGETDWKSEELLLWAGRAAAVGETQTASDLLESIAFPPRGQGWRVQATRAMIECAEGELRSCIDSFEGLSRQAPPRGLVHARATAAMVVEAADGEAARELLDDRLDATTARAALELGNVELAHRLAPQGPMREALEAE